MQKKLLIPLLILSFVSLFTLGVFTSWVYFSGIKIVPPIPKNSNDFREEYDVVIVSEETPYKVLVVDYFIENNRHFGWAHFYNDGVWESTVLKPNSMAISDVDSLNQYVSSVKGSFFIQDTKFDINIPEIYTSMVIRAEKPFVKFGGSTSKSDVFFSIDGELINSRAVLLKGYNTQIFDLDLSEYGVQTDWLVFWDSSKNFYHLDKTSLTKPHPIYTAHDFFSVQSFDTEVGNVTYFLHPDVVAHSSSNSALVKTDLTALELNLGSRYSTHNYGFSSYVTDSTGGVGVYLHLGN
ncbi:MAG: hypothetical protein ACOZAO_01090 [Patescibacteria group bacterium]